MRDYQIQPLRNICRQHPQYPAIKAATSIRQLSPQMINQIVSAFLPRLQREKNIADQGSMIYARARFGAAIRRGEL